MSNSHDTTVEMVWRLRDLAGALLRPLRGLGLLASYEALSDAQLSDIGIDRADLAAARSEPAPSRPRHLADAYLWRRRFDDGSARPRCC